jgi:hypothetical protein
MYAAPHADHDRCDVKRKMHPHSLANLRPPFKKGEVHNPRGINHRKNGFEKFLDRVIPRIAADIRRQRLQATPEMVTAAFVCTLLPEASAAEREEALGELLPLFQRGMRRGVK